MGSKIYEKAGPDVQNVINAMLRQYHNELHQLNVAVVATMIGKLNEEDELVRCLKHHGNWAAAVIRLVRPSTRIRVDYDAEIHIDKATWEELSPESRNAVIDHELEHLVICKNKEGQVIRDDRNNVKLKMRPDDFAVTGFYSVVARHGRNAVEYISIESIHERIHTALVEAGILPEPVNPPQASPTPAPVRIEDVVTQNILDGHREFAEGLHG